MSRLCRQSRECMASGIGLDMDISIEFKRELDILVSEKVSKIDWFAGKSGLNSLKIDANATLKIWSKSISEQPLHQSFMSDVEYHKLLKENTILGVGVCWRETLERVRYVLNVSVLRSQKWLEGIFLGVQYENLFVFAASYRGFIEATADSLDALKTISNRLPANKELIERILGGDTTVLLDGTYVIDYLDGELEAALIHFSHARETWREEFESPKSHKKKKFGEYIKSIDEEYREKTREAWLDLCQLTHPSAKSTMAYVSMGSDDEAWTVGVQKDFLEIILVTITHGKILADLCNELLSQLLVCQYLLRQLPYKEVHEPEFGVLLNSKD